MAVSFLSVSLISCYKDTTDQASKQASKNKKISLYWADF